MPKVIDSISDKAKDLSGLLANASIGGMQRFIAVNVAKGVISQKLEGIRSDQLWTAITDGVPPEDIWGTEDGYDLPEGTTDILRSLDSFVDVEKNIRALDDLVKERGGDIVELGIRETRPDLHEVIMNTPGGKSYLWHGARRLHYQLKQLAEEEL